MIDYLEIGATIFGFIQGILVMLNKRSNWIAYIIQMLFLVAFSLNSHLYGDVINNIVYIILGIIGHILWTKKDTSTIKKCSIKEKIIYIIAIITSTFYTKKLDYGYSNIVCYGGELVDYHLNKINLE